MAEERDGMDQDEPREEYLEFRRMMNSAGREDLRRMVERLAEKIEADPGDTGSLFLRGLTHGELGEHRLAAEDYGRVIALDPANAEARYNRGLVYRDLGELEQALAAFGAAVELEPNYGPARLRPGDHQPQPGRIPGRPPGLRWRASGWTRTTPPRCGAGASPWAAWAVTTRRWGTWTAPSASTQTTRRPSRPGG